MVPSSFRYDMINNVVEGSGMYHVTVRLLNGTYPLPQNYTLSPEDEVIIEVGLSSNMSQIKVVINKCWANPSNNPAELPNNVFFENRSMLVSFYCTHLTCLSVCLPACLTVFLSICLSICSCPVPNRFTKVLQNGESTRSLLSVNLFQLVEYDVIYLHCQIQICIEMSTATCRPVSLYHTFKLGLVNVNTDHTGKTQDRTSNNSDVKTSKKHHVFFSRGLFHIC